MTTFWLARTDKVERALTDIDSMRRYSPPAPLPTAGKNVAKSSP
jgi:hypothetical protein